MSDVVITTVPDVVIVPDPTAGSAVVVADAASIVVVGAGAGIPGSKGTDGLAGSNGASAYQIALANGFVGSQPVWLASLVGPAGVVPSEATIVCGEAVAAGAPVYVSLADGKLYNARADVWVKSKVIGLARAATAAGFACDVEGFALARSDWSSATGATALTVGALYYLGLVPGTLSLSRPLVAGQASAIIGLAASTTTLALKIHPPILL